MLKKLFLLISLSVILTLPAFSAVPRIALFYSKDSVVGSPSGSADELMCLQRLLEKGGWAVDRYNASERTWGGAPDTSDGEWFAARYVAVIIANADFFTAVTVTNTLGYGTSFQNSAGIARVSAGPLGGRWNIPVYVLAEIVIPTTSFNDTSSNLFVAGIMHTNPGGTFNKPAVASAGTWRYRLVGRLGGTGGVGPLDTLYADPRAFACRPSPWTGAGTVAALLWADTTNGLGTCVGVDTIMAAWRWRPKNGGYGVSYCLLQSDYSTGVCDGALWVLQQIATITTAKPNIVIAVPLLEHNSAPMSLTTLRINNYTAFRRKLSDLGIKVLLSSQCPGDLPYYNSSIGEIHKEAINRGSKWYPFSNFAFYAPSDTVGLRQLFNANANCGAQPDSMMLTKSAYYVKEVVSSQGNVSVWAGKVLKDAGVNIIHSTAQAPDANWKFLYSSSLGPLAPWVIPDGTNRMIFVRPVWGLGDFETYTTRVSSNGGRGDHEYVGSIFMRFLSVAATKGYNIYYHTNLNIGDDTYHQWLFGNVIERHFKYYDKIIKLDFTAAQTFTPQPQ